MGVCCPVLQILTLFKTKKGNFPHPFADMQTCIPVYRPRGGYKMQHYMYTWKRNYVIIAEIKTVKKKRFLKKNLFRIPISLFLSYIFGIETTNALIHNHGSFVNHTWLQTKMGKIYSCFQTKMARNPLPFRAAHTYLAYKRKYPPPPGSKMLQSVVIQFLSSNFIYFILLVNTVYGSMFDLRRMWSCQLVLKC